MSCFTQSNALAKSQKILAVCFCSPRTVKILFVNIKTAFLIVSPFLKPNCSGIKTLFTHKCWFSILSITLCNIFDNVVNNEFGLEFIILVLSPFLYMGLTVEYLSLSQYMPDFSEELHI